MPMMVRVDHMRMSEEGMIDIEELHIVNRDREGEEEEDYEKGRK